MDNEGRNFIEAANSDWWQLTEFRMFTSMSVYENSVRYKYIKVLKKI